MYISENGAVSLSAYAKINLTLTITGKRPDGFHTLQSVMQTISLADTVRVERIPAGIVFASSDPTLPRGMDNLCCKAARLYLDETGADGGAKIYLVKNIFTGAGLGGGSADAATVLRAMEALCGKGADLENLALRLGADVPFCLTPGTCFCEGIGEKRTPLRFSAKKDLFVVIAQGKAGLSTPAVYAQYDRVSSEKKSPSPAKEDVIQAFSGRDLKEIARVLHNDLELAAITLCPEIAAWKGALLDLGAFASMMTGSGSAVFGLFEAEGRARRAADTLAKEGAKTVFCTFL